MGSTARTGEVAWSPDSYDPWDQRMCLVPDGDLFEAIRTGAVEMITDRIDTLTESGVRLTSGAEVPADIIVTATGLELHLGRGAYTSVTPARDSDAVRAPFVPDFTPGYFRRGGAHFPSSGDRAPWRLRMNYLRDLPTFRHHRLEDGILQFTHAEHGFAEDIEPEASQSITC